MDWAIFVGGCSVASLLTWAATSLARIREYNKLHTQYMDLLKSEIKHTKETEEALREFARQVQLIESLQQWQKDLIRDVAYEQAAQYLEEASSWREYYETIRSWKSQPSAKNDADEEC